MRAPGPRLRLAFICCCAAVLAAGRACAEAPASAVQVVKLDGQAGGKRFDGIGVVNGGGATSVLLKDYPEPWRGEILDLLFKPKFGASVSALLVEIPGDGNSTQGSMPSHMHTRGDLDYSRGYTWWILREAKRRNPALTLDGAAWSAPGWVGGGHFWSQDMADYYVKWLRGLREVYGIEFDALGCRNESGVSLEFAKTLRKTLDAAGFGGVKIHGFDNWTRDKFAFVKKLDADPRARDAIGILSAHILAGSTGPASPEVRAAAAKWGKPIWNTEEHVYKKGFACLIGIVRAFNENFIRSGATRIVNWYDIAALYPIEPFPADPSALLAYWPWSGHYEAREALWGYAHYGQFSEAGWEYLNGGCGELAGGGSFVTLKSPGGDYSVILETSGAGGPQTVRFELAGGLPSRALCVWRSDAREQFAEQAPVTPADGVFTITLEPGAVYSLSTTRGQRKGAFADVPAAARFPFPYRDDFAGYGDPARHGRLPRYFADIEEAFELAKSPDGKGLALRQAVPAMPLSWASPEWRPYTIIGDAAWTDYEVDASVWLAPGESAGVMGRVNHVGTGFGTIPKGYLLELDASGKCELVAVRGKMNKKKPVGDAEQRAIIKAQKEDGAGGERVLAGVKLDALRPGQWHRLGLRFEGAKITGLVDGREVVSARDTLYPRGMAGLAAGRKGKKLDRPYFDDFVVKAVGAPDPEPTPVLPGQTPIYDPATVATAARAANQ